MTTLKNTTGSKAVNITTDATDHVCNEDAIVYETFDKQHFFENRKEGAEWYEQNYKSVRSASVACSICHRAANAMWLF